MGELSTENGGSSNFSPSGDQRWLGNPMKSLTNGVFSFFWLGKASIFCPRNDGFSIAVFVNQQKQGSNKIQQTSV
jgi:hypothetical protein